MTNKRKIELVKQALLNLQYFKHTNRCLVEDYGDGLPCSCGLTESRKGLITLLKYYKEKEKKDVNTD
jgi:hypothetical protein